MSYSYPIGGTPTQPTEVTYASYNISADLTLNWPFAYSDSSNVVAMFIDISATTTGLHLNIPDATAAPQGQAIIVNNYGGNSIEVRNASAGSIAVVAAGTTQYIVLRDNTTTAGQWRTFTLGAGTSSAQATALAGQGLSAFSGVLNVNAPVTFANSTYNAVQGDRGNVICWTGGVGTINLASAAGTLGNGWFAYIRNLGTGAVTLDPTGSDVINGASTLALAPGDSCIVMCSATGGREFMSIGLGRNATFSFTRLSKSVAGGSDVTLTTAEMANKVMEFTGILTANINVIFAATPDVYYLKNSTTGSFTLTVKNASGTGVAIPQGASRIIVNDGTNIIFANDAGSGTVTAVNSGTGLSGGPITGTGTLSITNTGVSAGTYGGALGVHSMTVNAQGQVTTESFTARTTAGTLNRISVLNGDGVSGAPTIDISSSYVGQATITTLGTITTGVWNGTAVPVANGGTGATTDSGARTNLGLGTIATQNANALAAQFTNTGLGVFDTDNSHYMRIICASDLTGIRNLNFIPGDSSRNITLSGNPTLADWFDQSVKVAATPTFAGLRLPNLGIVGPSGATGDYSLAGWNGASFDNLLTVTSAATPLLSLPKGQLKFPSTQNPSTDPNTIDDYKESDSFTPSITFAVAGNLSVAYTNQTGRYTKIGRKVTVDFNIVTSAFTHTTASGILIISGMPFTSQTLANNFSVGSLIWQGITKAGYTNVVTQIGSNSTALEVVAMGSGSTASNVSASDMPTGGSIIIRGTLTYVASS